MGATAGLIAAAASETLSVGSHVLALIKGIAEKNKAAGRAEANNDLIEVQLAMMDLLQKHQGLIEKNNALRDEVQKLKATLETAAAMEFHHSAYWQRLGPDILDGPFSPSSWGLEHKAVRMRNYGVESFQDGQKMNFHEPNSKDDTFVPLDFLRMHKVKHLQEAGL